MPTVILNGESRTIQAATVREMLVELGYGDKPVAVEQNQQVVPRKAHEQTPIADDDVIELVTLVGGG